MSKVLSTFQHWFGGGKTAAVPLPRDFESADIETWHAVSPFTMTSPERVFALRSAVRYVVQNGIPGDIVECGVWKGGSMMAVARTLLELNDTSRTLHLFDTFEGMPPPTAADIDYAGEEAQARLHRSEKDANVWAIAQLEQVKRAVLGVGYDAGKVRFVQGRVEDTIPGEAPSTISLLRLDTDWYESTKHELTHLFPRLSAGGVLIIDDYGHWQGARRATDEYFAENRIKLLLNRIDYTGRIGVKLG